MSNGMNTLIQVLMAKRQQERQQAQMMEQQAMGVGRTGWETSRPGGGAFLFDRPGGAMAGRGFQAQTGQETLNQYGKPSDLRKILGSDLQKTLDAETENMFYDMVPAKPFTVNGKKIQPGQTYEIDGRKITAPMEVKQKMSAKRKAEFMASLEGGDKLNAALSQQLNPMNFVQEYEEAWRAVPGNFGKEPPFEALRSWIQPSIVRANIARADAGLPPIAQAMVDRMYAGYGFKAPKVETAEEKAAKEAAREAAEEAAVADAEAKEKRGGVLRQSVTAAGTPESRAEFVKSLFGEEGRGGFREALEELASGFGFQAPESAVSFLIGQPPLPMQEHTQRAEEAKMLMPRAEEAKMLMPLMLALLSKRATSRPSAGMTGTIGY